MLRRAHMKNEAAKERTPDSHSTAATLLSPAIFPFLVLQIFLVSLILSPKTHCCISTVIFIMYYALNSLLLAQFAHVFSSPVIAAPNPTL